MKGHGQENPDVYPGVDVVETVLGQVMFRTSSSSNDPERADLDVEGVRTAVSMSAIASAGSRRGAAGAGVERGVPVTVPTCAAGGA